jgi:hypothetical protein
MNRDWKVGECGPTQRTFAISSENQGNSLVSPQ